MTIRTPGKSTTAVCPFCEARIGTISMHGTRVFSQHDVHGVGDCLGSNMPTVFAAEPIKSKIKSRNRALDEYGQNVLEEPPTGNG